MPRKSSKKSVKLPSGWMEGKWQPSTDEATEKDLTALVFGNENGRAWLNLQLDQIYCTVCPSNDHADLVAHNAQRALIHGILQQLDEHAHPDKYRTEQEQPQIEETDPRLQ